VQIFLVEVTSSYGGLCGLGVSDFVFNFSSGICLVRVSFDETNPISAPRTVIRVEAESNSTLIRWGSTGINAE